MKRAWLAFLIILSFSTNAFALSTLVFTVKTSGGHYTSVAAAEAGEQSDLITSDLIKVFECYSMEDTAAVVIDGWTMSATQYLEIKTPTAERHDGKWNTSKYRLIVNDANCIRNDEAYVRIEGLQLRRTYTSADFASAVYFPAALTSDCYIGYSIIETVGGNLTGLSHSNSNTLTLYNTVVGPTSYRGIFSNASGGELKVYNCTIAKNGNDGINEGVSATVTVKNTTVADTSDDFDFSGSGSIDYCASDDGDGTNAQTLSGTRANDFVDFTNADFHIASGSVQIDNGVSDPGSGLYSDDIDGDTRSGSWDIGTDEIVAAAVNYIFFVR